MRYSALVGHPVNHSVSPLLFNKLSSITGIDYSHIKIDVPQEQSIGDVIEALATLGFCGANVTLPYKTAVLEFCDSLSVDAANMGAVNTLRFEDGQVYGSNTDAQAALNAIDSKWKKVSSSDRVLILGSGGAARAVAYALAGRSPEMIVVAKDVSSAMSMAEQISSATGARITVNNYSRTNLLESIVDATLVVNATPVGMHPYTKQSIIDPLILIDSSKQCDFRSKCFFDVVFNPAITKMLSNASDLGAVTIQGIFMLIHQAVIAFEIWTKTQVSLCQHDIDSISEELCAAMITTVKP